MSLLIIIITLPLCDSKVFTLAESLGGVESLAEIPLAIKHGYPMDDNISFIIVGVL